MALLTITDVQDEATIRGIDLTGYSDAMLARKIAAAQAYIESQTGRTFTTTTVTGEQHLQNKGNTILLDNGPVVSVEKILIDDSEYDLTDITVNYETGVIYLSTPSNPSLYSLNSTYDALIDYTYCETETSNVFLVCSDICMDLFFINLDKTEDSDNIVSFRDSDFQVQYDGKSALRGIDDRLSPYKRVTVRMI